MHPVADDPVQQWGVLNPAAARDRKGDLWVFPRLVAEQNFSRIGRARVRSDVSGDPVGTDPPSIVLEPTEIWESNSRTAGVEDPRITWIPTLDRYVMTYTAYGPLGPRIGLALSADLEQWDRLGPLRFDYESGIAYRFRPLPEQGRHVVSRNRSLPRTDPPHTPSSTDRSGICPSTASSATRPRPPGSTDHRPGIWVSFADAERVAEDLADLDRVGQHRQVATSEQPWELIKIGGGTPPIRTPGGWLTLYHGVAGIYEPGKDQQQGSIMRQG